MRPKPHLRVVVITDRIGTGAGWARYSASLIPALEAAGCTVDTVSHIVPGSLEPSCVLPPSLSYRRVAYFAWWYALRIRLSYRKELAACDVIHCFIETYAPIAFALARISGKPYIITGHGSFGLKVLEQKTPLPRLQLSAYRHAARIICVSEYVRDQLAARLGLRNVGMVPNGVNGAHFVQDDSRRIRDLLLTVSSLKPRKGIHLVIEALPAVVKAIPHLRYMIAAGPDNPVYAEGLKRRVAELGLSEHVTFLGRTADAELLDLYGKARAFVLTTISSAYDFEGLGLVCLEANAAGIPVIGMQDPGAKQAIKDGVSGLLAKEGDSADIADTIIRVMTDDALHARLVEGGRQWAAEHDWSRIAERYIEQYQDVIRA